MADKIRIDDLAAPRLTDAQRAALEYTSSLNIDVSVESILAEARERTGLTDIGNSTSLDRLALLCDEWSADDGLTNLGRLSLRNKLLQHTSSRLLIEDFLQRHPEVHDVQIQSPIIVAGLPRSGTTHLLNLMAADTRLRALPLWESYEPLPLPGDRPADDGVDPRYTRCAQQWEAMQMVTPLLAAMHPMNPEHIHEELELMGPNFASYNYEWLAPSPRWRDHYYQHDQTPHYEYMRTVLKILTWRDGDTDGSQTRWVLKCPQHLEQLPVLKAIFPDATVPITHRDPVSVIQSAVTMLAYGQRTSRQRVEIDTLFDYWCERIGHLLDACLRDRDCFSEAQSLDVHFDAFMADDLAMVEKIYALAGLPMTAQARTELTDFIASHPRGKHGQVVYDLRTDFGAEPDAVRARFNDYMNHFDVSVEVR